MRVNALARALLAASQAAHKTAPMAVTLAPGRGAASPAPGAGRRNSQAGRGGARVGRGECRPTAHNAMQKVGASRACR